ncbi:hypothetical protein V5799_006523 [Amblyomma americanum]|uniref:Sulfotransferase domain-containing protein n=1 Tax=Amblyomma americanum TaxID=6943 RepID=A0AAQ4DW65_AMBAM
MPASRGSKEERLWLICGCIMFFTFTRTLEVDAKLISPGQLKTLSDDGADDHSGVNVVVPDYERSPTTATGGRRSSWKNDAEEKRVGGGVDKLEKRLPSALIIGVKKAGTRALLEFLRLHPDVRATGPETHFFDRHYNRGIEWYRIQMPLTLPDQITMEKTPSYFVTREVPARIRAMRPDVRLLVVVRDPVTRALSDYAQTASKRPDTTLPFEVLAFSKRRRKRRDVTMRHRDPASRKGRVRSGNTTFSSGGTKPHRDSTSRKERVLNSRSRKDDALAFPNKQLKDSEKPFDEDRKLNAIDAGRGYAAARNDNSYGEENTEPHGVTSKTQAAFTTEAIFRNKRTTQRK